MRHVTIDFICTRKTSDLSRYSYVAIGDGDRPLYSAPISLHPLHERKAHRYPDRPYIENCVNAIVDYSRVCALRSVGSLRIGFEKLEEEIMVA